MRSRSSLIAVFLLGFLGITLFWGCAVSPHGGVVPIWADTMNQHKVTGGDGSSFRQAVVLKNGSLISAEGYEIQWFVEHAFKNKPASARVWEEARLYDVVKLENGSRIYFDLTELKQ
jgi:hypothetical protein